MKETKYNLEFDTRIYNFESIYSVYRIESTGKDPKRSHKLTFPHTIITLI